MQKSANKAPSIAAGRRPSSTRRPPISDAALQQKRLIGKRELAALLSVNSWTVDRWRKTQRDFPKPIWISDSTPRWNLLEIEEWLASKQRGGVAPTWMTRSGGQ